MEYQLHFVGQLMPFSPVPQRVTSLSSSIIRIGLSTALAIRVISSTILDLTEAGAAPSVDLSHRLAHLAPLIAGRAEDLPGAEVLLLPHPSHHIEPVPVSHNPGASPRQAQS